MLGGGGALGLGPSPLNADVVLGQLLEVPVGASMESRRQRDAVWGCLAGSEVTRAKLEHRPQVPGRGEGGGKAPSAHSRSL